jgi:hypothetical protein
MRSKRGFLRVILYAEVASKATCGCLARQALVFVLSGLMVVTPMGFGDAFAQSVPRPPEAGSSQPAPPAPPEQPPDGGVPAQQAPPLSADQLDQLVAPIALYPDALVAQILAAATYPTQVVEADRWRQSQGDASPEQIAAAADSQNWDPSVKALTAFPTVLAQMDNNIRWTTDLGNAYYNGPQDVMDAVQAMRQKAQAAGHLQTTPQQTVGTSGGTITVAPASPTVVYVPVYDPWVVYGPPIPVYAGYYYAPPPGIFWGGLAIGFGAGIAIGFFAPWGWGWGHWGIGWGSRVVVYNHVTYLTRSTTVVNYGWGRSGGPPAGFGVRGAYVRASAATPGAAYRAQAGLNRPAANVSRQATSVPRPNGPVAQSAASGGRPVPRPPAGANQKTGSQHANPPRASKHKNPKS